MGSFSCVRRRARPETRGGHARARAVAVRLGVGLRTARVAAGRTQAEVGDRAGVSQSLISVLERGRGMNASIETWSCVAAAIGEQFVAFLELVAGSTPPRDIQHLRRQSALIELAAGGGWTALPELAIEPAAVRSRAIDVALVRRSTREAVAAEIWDWFDDVGAALRGLDAKVSMLERRLSASGASELPESGSDWRVRGMFIVRGTHRNRSLVADLRPLFAARFPGSPVGWLGALTRADVSVPPGDGFLWSDGTGTSLRAARVGRPGRGR
jgi:transcriptional regulator with XRE-family HTH domain